MSTDYQFPMFARLEPHTQQFKGGRITDTDVLTLDEAAKYASQHADTEITPGDFLRAATRGEVTLRAIVHRESKLQKHDGGIYCNQGMPTENTVPKGAVATLPLSACRQLANAGRASWRTLDGFEYRNGELARFTVARLADSEPDFETVPADCRVTGYEVHALADAYIDAPAPFEAPEKYEPPAVPSITSVGVNKVEILCVEWPTAPHAPTMANVLRELPKWVNAACTKVGRRGKGVRGSHLWNPAILAYCLATRTPHKQWAVGKGALTSFLRANFPDYFEQWESVSRDL